MPKNSQKLDSVSLATVSRFSRLFAQVWLETVKRVISLYINIGETLKHVIFFNELTWETFQCNLLL